MKFIHVIYALLFASGCSAVPLEGRADKSSVITAETAEVGMVLMVRLKHMESRCKAKHTDWTRTHPMLIMSVKDGVVKVCPISKENPLSPNVDVSTVASGLGAVGQIYVGPPCTIKLGNSVTEWKSGKRATSTEIKAVRNAIQTAENAESVPQVTGKAKVLQNDPKGKVSQDNFKGKVLQDKSKGKIRSKL
ncbi:hypothetical protein Hypma_002406 [Hypsizygus marmoreus]|uniref:Uncharacterized protein n=1 Tax=Hypsizygus marmoreus TaxID=39966 RepID=A0A369J4N2_HYPMA|nr:hypothetical protein Hypma_002406 [Hypsizygus marmoreus]